MGLLRLAAAGLFIASVPALAHSPYLMPNHFDASQRDHVSVLGSFTEEFFIPDVAMKAADYHVVGPDGRKQALTPVYSKDLAVIDVDTKSNGSYRISTGLREGSTRKAALVNGQWEFFAAADAPKEAVDMQSWTRADVYVSRGTPQDSVLAQSGKALEIQPITHPNKLFAGQKLQLRVLFEGKPLADPVVLLTAGRDAGGDTPAPVEVKGGADGMVLLPLPRAGVFHVQARHRHAPQAAGKPGRSYTTALTIEVTE